jgi:hypothetical protein
MAKVKLSRDSKQQLGQFMTPDLLVKSVLSQPDITLTKTSRILEPSLGLGAFIFGLIEQLLPFYPEEMARKQKVLAILKDNLYGVEYDPQLFLEFKVLMLATYSVDLDQVPHNFVVGDFFRYEPTVTFDFIIGNPPFGGSFDPTIEDELDRRYGQWEQWKIKKETYAFFVIICLGMLAEGGVLSFILSDTFLTISTMQGLRRCAFSRGEITIRTLDYFSDETNYGMAVLNVKSGIHVPYITFNDEKISLEDITGTPNYSWKINSEFAKYFKGKRLGDFILASSGMTIGKNELFLRKIAHDNSITETYDFEIVDQPITLEDEIKRARLGKISENKQRDIRDQETQGATRKAMRITPKAQSIHMVLPNADYRFYNKATNASYYEAPRTVIYWKNDGEAVYTFKKSGSWYLHGVGGKPFFKKEGLTWNLISTSVKARYLPEGYILDSGAPIAILRPDVAHEELWFILGWINTRLATDILKGVINHTKNIQSKDIEKMPYPVWVSKANKVTAIKLVQEIVAGLKKGDLSDSAKAENIQSLEGLYAYKN